MPPSVLICTLGAAPQVVTLLLDTLLARGWQVERVVIVHTNPAFDPIRRSLSRLHEDFVTCNHYRGQVLYDPHVLTNADGQLDDVITAEEIEAAHQHFYSLIRQYKQVGCTVHLGIAGGRKTLAVLAMAAAQTLFSHADHIWHLVSPEPVLKSEALHIDDPSQIYPLDIPLVNKGYLGAVERSRTDDFIQNHLTDAEREITQLLLREGLSNAVLAQRLSKSSSTIANQLTGIYRKLETYYKLDTPPNRTTLLTLLGSSS